MYTPKTLEENWANVRRMTEDYWWYIQKIRNDYGIITNKFWYNGGNYNNVARREYELDMQWLAYGVFGFTSDIYERLAYAVDYWRRLQDRRNKDNPSDKKYDQSLRLLAEKRKITGDMKEKLLPFRIERNNGTHYGRIILVDYILRNAQVVYEFICVVDNLLSGYDYNELQYKQFMNSQTQFVQDIEKLFSTFIESEEAIAI
jgi:hypothetical protein